MKKRVRMFFVSIIVIISYFSSTLAKDNQNTKLSPDGCFPFTPAEFVQAYNEAMAKEDIYIAMANLKVSNTPVVHRTSRFMNVTSVATQNYILLQIKNQEE